MRVLLFSLFAFLLAILGCSRDNTRFHVSAPPLEQAVSATTPQVTSAENADRLGPSAADQQESVPARE